MGVKVPAVKQPPSPQFLQISGSEGLSTVGLRTIATFADDMLNGLIELVNHVRGTLHLRLFHKVLYLGLDDESFILRIFGRHTFSCT